MYIVKTKYSNDSLFEGPLDLLLELIEKNKLAITDVSLADVADEFIEYLYHSNMNVQPDYLADFVLVASRLILIKSKAILPLLELSREEEEDIAELKYRLVEYQKFKTIFPVVYADFIGGWKCFVKLKHKEVAVKFCPPVGLTVDQLRDNYVLLLSKAAQSDTVGDRGVVSTISIYDKIQKIKSELLNKIHITFENAIVDCESKVEVIVMFLAILELVRKNYAIVEQVEEFGEIKIIKKDI